MNRRVGGREEGGMHGWEVDEKGMKERRKEGRKVKWVLYSWFYSF